MSQVLPIVFIVLSAASLLAALGALWFSLRGLLGDDEAVLIETEASRHYGELLDEKAAVLRSIKDLEFEHEVGKLSDADFERLNKQFRRRAKEILRELDRDLGPYRDKAKTLIETGAKQGAKS